LLTFAGMTPKLGNRAEECEDQFSASGRRFAVADGASESGYSQMWARILAEAFCRTETADCTPVDLESWLDECRGEWKRWAGERALHDLPWFARETLRDASFATFVGLVFPRGRDEKTAAAWHAVACGDACLFLVRDDRLAGAFPLVDSGAFDNTPELVTTSPGSDRMRLAMGTAQLGDAFYLVTDALARWFLVDHARGEKPWMALDRVRTPRDLEHFVAVSRKSRAIRNDDVTLMSIAIVADE
jgi:hypothetical protein